MVSNGEYIYTYFKKCGTIYTSCRVFLGILIIFLVLVCSTMKIPNASLKYLCFYFSLLPLQGSIGSILSFKDPFDNNI